MNFETQTYHMKVQSFPILGGPLGRPLGAGPIMAPDEKDGREAAPHVQSEDFGDSCFGVTSLGIWEFLAWCRLWFAALTEKSLNFCHSRPHFKHRGAQGYQRPPSLLPEAARAAFAPRIVSNRQSRRILARGLPPSRSYAALHHLNARRLNIGQFKERACRLSASNRIVIYRLSGRKRLCQCRETIARLTPTPHSQGQLTFDLNSGLNEGVCDAHLWPG